MTSCLSIDSQATLIAHCAVFPWPQAYLAYDNSSTAARPAIIIIPDWDGIGGYEEWRAKLLANLGYVGGSRVTKLITQF